MMTKPRIGCLGVGWIGRHRMQCVVDSGAAEIVALHDPDEDATEVAVGMLPHARRLEDAAALLERELDGIMIATPSAQHSAQSIVALQHGLAVFCQKPLARTAAETWSVVSAARSADRLLGIDFSYRRVRSAPQMRELVGAIGELFAAELVFHNAMAPASPGSTTSSSPGAGA